MDKEPTNEIKKLTQAIRKSTNLWWNFLRGIFYGFGFFIGSAFLAAILIYVLSKIQGWAYIGDIIKKILEISGQV